MRWNEFNLRLKLRMLLTDGAKESAEKNGHTTPLNLCLFQVPPILLGSWSRLGEFVLLMLLLKAEHIVKLGLGLGLGLSLALVLSLG